MNIFKILPFLLLTFSTAYAQKTTTISFKIDGYTEGSVQLIGIFFDANYLADSAKIQPDGRIVFNSKEGGYEEGLFFLLLPDKNNIQFLAVNGENFKITARKNDLINSLKAENSIENELFFENQKYQVFLEQRFNNIAQGMKQVPAGSAEYSNLRKEQQRLIEERDNKMVELKQKYPNAFFTKFKIAGQNPRLRYSYRADGSLDSNQTMVNFRNDWWSDVDFTDKRIVRTPVYFNKLKKYITELTAQHHDSLIQSADFLIEKTLNNKDLYNVTVNWTAYSYKPGMAKIMDGDAVYSHIVLKYFTLEKADWIGQKVADITSLRKSASEMQASLIGMTGQDVRAENSKGEFKTIYGLKSKYTVVFIYNPDCEHCQEETPHLRKVYDQWKSRGLEVYSVAANAKSRDEWQKFAVKYGVNWTDVWDPELKSRFHEKYFVDITPECYLLDKDHKIIAKNIKPLQVAEILEREMKKNK